MVLHQLTVFSLKRSTVGAFAVRARVLRRKQIDRRYLTMNFTRRSSLKQSSLSGLVLSYNWYHLRDEKNSNHAHKKGSLGFFSKFPSCIPYFLWKCPELRVFQGVNLRRLYCQELRLGFFKRSSCCEAR